MVSKKEQINEAFKNPKFIYVNLKTWIKHEGNNGGFVLQWAAKRIGFGEISFIIGTDGKYYVDTEALSKEFCNKVLNKFFDSCILR